MPKDNAVSAPMLDWSSVTIPLVCGHAGEIAFCFKCGSVVRISASHPEACRD